jgi:hypothetical protein
VKASQIIDQIKALSNNDKAKVFDYVLTELNKPKSVKYANDQVFLEAAKWTFQKHKDLISRLSK